MNTELMIKILSHYQFRRHKSTCH